MPTFTSLTEFQEIVQHFSGPDAAIRQEAMQRNGVLTKPYGSLGKLEELAIWYASWRAELRPVIRQSQIIIFAGNHGVVAQGVSAFPAEVTAQMVENFWVGGAAINQLAKAMNANLTINALELDHPTADFTQGPAMSEAELLAALSCGWHSVDQNANILVVGEMGIGNTTAASAICCALFGGGAGVWVGRGTGVDDAGIARKIKAVEAGVKRHGHNMPPMEVLRTLGGREIAAMTGAIARARDMNIPVILDGFICTAAAAILHEISPTALDHCVAGHSSAESAHAKLLGLLGKEPLLDLGLRLGEGTGAALAIGILKGAVACYSGMATFAEAGVSDKEAPVMA